MDTQQILQEISIEVCLDSVESSINAQQGGADRVELCDNLFQGGTTPSIGTIRAARKAIDIGLQVIIRPRGGDFLYSDYEFEVMKEDILAAGEAGADGVVFGILTPDGLVDRDRNALLRELAGPMNATFHRAFDVVRNPFDALETIIDLGFNRILTSGQAPTVLEGLNWYVNLSIGRRGVSSSCRAMVSPLGICRKSLSLPVPASIMFLSIGSERAA